MPLRPKYRARLKTMTAEQAADTLIRTVRRLEIMLTAMFVALVLGAVAMWPTITGRGARTDYVNQQIRNIWCTLVAGQPDSADSRIHKIRSDYRCPPFDPKKFPKAAASASAKASASTSAKSATPVPSRSSTPGAAPLPTPSVPGRAGPTDSARSTATRFVQIAGPTRTVVRVGVVTVPAPLALPTVLAPLPGCRLNLVGVRVC